VGDLLPAGEVAAARAALADLFPSAESREAAPGPDRGSGFDARREADKPVFPFESMALNRLCVHHALIDLAEDLLDTEHVRLYQALASAKYFPGHPDDEQLLHVDYGNHTLVVPRTDVGYQHLELFVYLSDVTAETAATRIVSRQLTGEIPTERTYLSVTDYPHLYEAEEPAVGGSGSVLAYRPDVYHRGVRMTAPDAARFMLHVSFKPAQTDWLGSQAWPGAAEGMAWHRFMHGPSVRQLSMLGFPPPGHPYWNEDTLRGVARRYPSLDLTPWREA
jgi:hypothetical protein